LTISQNYSQLEITDEVENNKAVL